MSFRRKSESGKVLRENHKLIFSLRPPYIQTKNKTVLQASLCDRRGHRAVLKSYCSSKVHKRQPHKYHIFLHGFMNPGNATLYNPMERNHMV